MTLLGVRGPECACSPSFSTPALDLGQFYSPPPTTQVLRLKEDPLTENVLLPATVHAQVPQSSAKTSLGSVSDF